MGKVWILDTETKGTGAEMVPLEKVLQESPPRPAPVLTPERPKRLEPPAPRAPWRFKVVDVMTRQVVAEDLDARATVDLLKGFRSIVDVSVYAWDEAAANWRALTLADRRTLWSFRDRSG
jgi:hypothetical protein